MGIWRPKKGGQSEKQLKALSLKKTKENKEKNKAGSGQAEADEGSVQRVELPHPGQVVAGSGRRPGPANFPGSLLWLKRVGSMAS